MSVGFDGGLRRFGTGAPEQRESRPGRGLRRRLCRRVGLSGHLRLGRRLDRVDGRGRLVLGVEFVGAQLRIQLGKPGLDVNG